MTCKHWKKYPKTSGKPVCAFTSRGKFKSNNWNCYHINRLRELCRSTSVFFETAGKIEPTYNDDQYSATIPFSNCRFALLFWYKGRGRTEAFFVAESLSDMVNWNIRTGTEQDVDTIMKEYKKKVKPS